MTHRNGYPDGAPCWVDLNTPDLEGAKRFYTALLGWSYDAADPAMGYYTMARVHGGTVAAIAPKQPGMDMPTVWTLYLKTSDIDETARRFTAGGGNMMVPPMDIPGAGRMAFGFDNTRAAIGFWQPSNHTGAQRYDEPGAMCWSEVATPDGAAADVFYRDLFPYEMQQIGDGKNFDYTMWSLDNHAVAGRLQMTDEWKGIPPHWITYFVVDNCDASSKQVTELGGQLKHGPFDSPHGRIAVVADPWGAIFSIIQRPAAAA